MGEVYLSRSDPNVCIAFGNRNPPRTEPLFPGCRRPRPPNDPTNRPAHKLAYLAAIGDNAIYLPYPLVDGENEQLEPREFIESTGATGWLMSSHNDPCSGLRRKLSGSVL